VSVIAVASAKGVYEPIGIVKVTGDTVVYVPFIAKLLYVIGVNVLFKAVMVTAVGIGGVGGVYAVVPVSVKTYVVRLVLPRRGASHNGRSTVAPNVDSLDRPTFHPVVSFKMGVARVSANAATIGPMTRSVASRFWISAL
jgi:hypothetical protein